MRPTTKVQIEVDTLKLQLKFTESQETWAKDHVFDNVIYQTKNERWCVHCGKTHKVKDYECNGKSMVCPHCGHKGTIMKSAKRKIDEWEYYLVVDTVDRWQVLRLFLVRMIAEKGYDTEYDFYEVSQRWFVPGKHEVVREVPFKMNGTWYKVPFNLNKEMTYRRNAKCRIGTMPIYPYKKVLKEYSKYGVTTNFHRINPVYLMREVPNNPKYETLLKCGFYKALGYFMSQYSDTYINEYWDSMKICIRNHYEPSGMGMWCDTIRALNEIGRDIRNPFYVCPRDLTRAHDDAIDKREKKRLKEMEEKRAEECRQYVERIAPYLDLLFKDNELEVFVLPTVKDIKQEGDYLHHCIYKMEYFNKENSLLLTARVNGERTESIEYDIEKDVILQCRGDHNKNTEYHDRILRLVEKNKKHIRRCTKAANASIAV